MNWTKVTKNRDAFKYEVALLKSLKNSTNPVSDLRDLLTKYPEVVKVIPILLAWRDGLKKVLNSERKKEGLPAIKKLSLATEAIIKAKVTKNKVASPYGETIFHLYFDTGVSKKDTTSKVEEIDEVDDMEEF